MINGKMYRHEIHDHTDIVLVAGINGFVTRGFAERHDLDIVIIIFLKIRDQDVDHFYISVPVVCLFRRLLK